MPLLGALMRQLPSSDTGVADVIVGMLVSESAVSDSRMRRLAFVNRRSPNSTGLEVFSVPAGRRTRSGLLPPIVMSGRLSGLAPVRPLRIQLL